MKTATPSPATPDPIEALCDFSDRHSPIVVKELRQGLRQPSFVILFLFLQSVLALAVISALFSVSSATLSSRVNMGNVISGFFFVLFGLAVFVIQPIRALNALSSEQRDSTIDLLLLTRLDAWRIVVGKWLCLVTQSALLLVAMLPYLMMRYFLGGMNLFGELGILAALFLLGAMMCAAGIGMSAVRSVILRVIFSVIGVIAFLVLFQGFGVYYAYSSLSSSAGIFGTMLNTSDWVMLLLGSLLLTAFLTHASLEFGATRIAPPAENRSTRKRLVALASLVGIPALFAIPETTGRFPFYLSLLLIGAVAMADSLSENPRHVRRMKRGSLWLLRPGWPPGAVFSLLVLGICALWGMLISSAFAARPGFDYDTHMRWMQVVGVCLFMVAQPALIVAIFRPHDSEPSNLYLTGLLGSLALGLVLLMVGTAMGSHESICFVFFPAFPVLGLGLLQYPTGGKVLVFFIIAAVYLFGAAWIGYRLWKPYAVTKPSTATPPPA